jgi:hypothetical protein
MRQKALLFLPCLTVLLLNDFDALLHAFMPHAKPGQLLQLFSIKAFCFFKAAFKPCS